MNERESFLREREYCKREIAREREREREKEKEKEIVTYSERYTCIYIYREIVAL
jgi:hypothetical protein